MSWDRDRYRERVLDPARLADNVPPIYPRYDLPPGIADENAVTERIAAVTAYWQELARTRSYGKLTRTLLDEHKKLGPLTPRTLAELDRRASEQLDAQLTALAAAEARAATCIGPDTVRRLSEELGVPETTVAAKLREHGVLVVSEFPRLGEPHPKQPDLARHVTALGVRVAADVVFSQGTGGFRVLTGFRLADGRRLDETALTEARRRAAALRYDDSAKAATENVLALLSAARLQGQLDALLLSEIVEPLRDSARRGWTQPAIAVRARDRGLAEDEASLLAATVLAEQTPDVVREQVRDQLANGRLRTAQRTAEQLPADDQLRDRLRELATKIEMLNEAAELELVNGNSELAARRFAEALRIASDDADLGRRLAAIAPPPVRNATARVDGDKVVVAWTPSPALAGDVGYRVTRGEDRAPGSPAEGTTVIEDTGRYDVVDQDPPPGVALHYSVFAHRGGERYSPAACTPAVIFAPDVTEVTVTATETSVAVSWRLPPAADSVEVTRDGATIEAAPGGFTDRSVRTGITYRYRIKATYQARQSPGVTVSVTPEPEPQPEPATALTAQRVTDQARLAWAWPAGATDAVLRWRDEQQRITRRRYHDEGGATITIGPDQTRIEVSVQYPGQLSAPAAAVTVPARGVVVRYRILGSRWRRRRRTIEFSAERATVLPEITVVRTTGRYPPDDPAGGEVLTRVESRPVSPDERVPVTVTVPRGPGWLSAHADGDVLLLHPPNAQMELH